MDVALQMPGSLLNALVWAHHVARAEGQSEIRLPHLLLGIVVTYSELDSTFSTLISSNTAKSILRSCGQSVPTFANAGIRPVPHTDMPLSADIGHIFQELMQTGGAFQKLTVDDLLRAVIPAIRESLEEEERHSPLERQMTLILQRD